MPFKFIQKTVPLIAINSGIETYRITTNSSVEDLVPTFNRVGLINPPILIPRGNGYGVVCGYRRIAAARFLLWEAIPARILVSESDNLLCATLAISENSIERSLNLIETSRAFSLLSSVIPEKERLLKTAKELGLPYSPSLLEKIVPLCHLPDDLQRGLLSGDLALPSALMLSKLPVETAVSLAILLSSLKISLHKQRELISIIQEISLRDDCSIKNILESQEMRLITDDPEIDLPRKANLIREYLKRRRYPHLSQTQDSFDCLKGTLSLGEHTTLKPPPGFESNRYTISFTFANLNDLEDLKNALEALSKDEKFVDLLSSRGLQAD